MGIFDGIEEAPVGQDANYQREGNYVERVDNVKVGQTRKKVDFFAIEKTCVAIDDAPDYPQGHKVGEQYCDMIMANQDGYLSRIKGFCVSVLDMDGDDINGEFLNELCGEGQPLAGTCIRSKSRPQKSKSTDTVYAKTTYQGQLDAEEFDALDDKAKSYFDFEGSYQPVTFSS